MAVKGQTPVSAPTPILVRSVVPICGAGGLDQVGAARAVQVEHEREFAVGAGELAALAQVGDIGGAVAVPVLADGRGEALAPDAGHVIATVLLGGGLAALAAHRRG